MLELIVHHSYKQSGENVDISSNDNHGVRTVVPHVPDGRMSGNGALRFSGGQLQRKGEAGLFVSARM